MMFSLLAVRSYTNAIADCCDLSVWFAEYDEDVDDGLIMLHVDDSADLQSYEASPQLNHMHITANGDVENDIDAVKQHIPVVHRRSSTSSAVVSPVNGLKTHEHNIILQRMAVVEVKKPGKGSTLYIGKYTLIVDCMLTMCACFSGQSIMRKIYFCV